MGKQRPEAEPEEMGKWRLRDPGIEVTGSITVGVRHQWVTRASREILRRAQVPVVLPVCSGLGTKGPEVGASWGCPLPRGGHRARTAWEGFWWRQERDRGPRAGGRSWGNGVSCVWLEGGGCQYLGGGATCSVVGEGGGGCYGRTLPWWNPEVNMVARDKQASG